MQEINQFQKINFGVVEFKMVQVLWQHSADGLKDALAHHV